MSEQIDYEALCKRLIVENELLRQGKKQTVIHVGTLALRLRSFVEENYLLIMVALFLITSLVSGLYTVYQDRKRP